MKTSSLFRLVSRTALAATLISASLSAGSVLAQNTTAGTTPEMQINVVGSQDDKGIKRPEIGDAPAGDFERVAWCHGILSGHMALAEVVAPVSPPSEEMKSIGTAYLRSYEAALTLSGKGKDEASYQRADAARKAGLAAWEPSMKADLQTAAWLYDNWSLPGDCERAAVALSGRPNLFAEMATEEEAEIIHQTLTSGGAQGTAEIGQPRLVARTVNDADADGAIATNRAYVRPAPSGASGATAPSDNTSGGAYFAPSGQTRSGD